MEIMRNSEEVPDNNDSATNEISDSPKKIASREKFLITALLLSRLISGSVFPILEVSYPVELLGVRRCDRGRLCGRLHGRLRDRILGHAHGRDHTRARVRVGARAWFSARIRVPLQNRSSTDFVRLFKKMQAKLRGMNNTLISLLFGVYPLMNVLAPQMVKKMVYHFELKHIIYVAIGSSAINTVIFGLLEYIPKQGSYNMVFIILSFIVRALESLGCGTINTAVMTFFATEFPDDSDSKSLLIVSNILLASALLLCGPSPFLGIEHKHFTGFIIAGPILDIFGYRWSLTHIAFLILLTTLLLTCQILSKYLPKIEDFRKLWNNKDEGKHLLNSNKHQLHDRP
ncbi:Hypothetical predicted protein [Octopus vulgaris]|uniref:Uncharacterized protein n=1 Tax=Octopus vulgaris TaxID=6645 RepID=A0AA36F8W8_OCTVU|nr:Hypothetical predicted protein [Octopus vulgaris]